MILKSSDKFVFFGEVVSMNITFINPCETGLLTKICIIPDPKYGRLINITHKKDMIQEYYTLERVHVQRCKDIKGFISGEFFFNGTDFILLRTGLRIKEDVPIIAKVSYSAIGQVTTDVFDLLLERSIRILNSTNHTIYSDNIVNAIRKLMKRSKRQGGTA